MDENNHKWSSWLAASGQRQVLVVTVAALLLSALIAIAYWWLRPNYQVLFSNLRAQDAATIVAELERQKLPFRLGDGGNTVLVPEGQVHDTRLKVMSRELPLKGTVGFELFNNADLGLTEFAQKVNYQRALQGELARTIMSLAEIENARVHLSMPEAGLFRRQGAKPRASVALTTKSGQDLPADTVRGVQRLVAAAVPELEPHEVTIIDPRGAPMANAAHGDVVSDRKLELKIELEQYYVRKLTQQLEPIVGTGNALVSVDASLNFDQLRVTQERQDAGATSRRPSSTTRTTEAVLQLSALRDDVADEKIRLPTTAEPATRRLEQIVASPGSVRRLNIGVLLQSGVDNSTLDQLRQLVVATAGLSVERGDSVVLFARDRFSPGMANNEQGSAKRGDQREDLRNESRHEPRNELSPIPSKASGLAHPASLQLDASGPLRAAASNESATQELVPSKAPLLNQVLQLLTLMVVGAVAIVVLVRSIKHSRHTLGLMTPGEREQQLKRLREALAKDFSNVNA